jgi:hypothetical protein
MTCVISVEANIPLDKLVVLFLTDPRYEALAREFLAQSVCGQSVLGEAEVEEGGDVDVGCCKLLLLLDEVGAAYEADSDLVAKL